MYFICVFKDLNVVTEAAILPSLVGFIKYIIWRKRGIKTIHARKDVRLEGNTNALVTFQGVLGIYIYLRYTSYRNGSVAYPFT